MVSAIPWYLWPGPVPAPGDGRYESRMDISAGAIPRDRCEGIGDTFVQWNIRARQAIVSKSSRTGGDAMRRVWTPVALLVGGTIAMTQTPMEARSEAMIVAKPAAQAKTEGGTDAIRPFRVHFPDEALADLKRRV